MGIEELKRTLTRTLFDSEGDGLDILTVEEELRAIREDPEEREQMIRFVLDASSKCCWTPLADDFIDIVKSELFKIFHEVYLLPAWHRRESTWMNHALQLAKLHYDQLIDEQQRTLQQKNLTTRSGNLPCANRVQTSPGAFYCSPASNINGVVDHLQSESPLQIDMRSAQHRQQMCVVSGQTRGFLKNEDFGSPTILMHNPTQPYMDCDIPVRSGECIHQSQLNSKCTPTHNNNSFGFDVNVSRPNNECMYQPRHIVVPAADMWNRQCIPIDRRRLIYDSNGMSIIQPSSVYPIKAMSKDGHIIVEGQILPADRLVNGTIGSSNLVSGARYSSDASVYSSHPLSIHACSPVQSNLNQMYSNDIYNASSNISPLRLNSGCNQISYQQYPQQQQPHFHQSLPQYQQHRFRLMDSATASSDIYSTAFIDQNEYVRFRSNVLPDGSNQVVQAMPQAP